MSNRYVILDNRTVLAFSGKDAHSFLQNTITQDISLLTPFQSLYSALLNAQGKYLFDFFIIGQGDTLWLECERARVGALTRLLSLYRMRAEVHIQDLSETHHVLAAVGDVSQLALPEHEGRTERFQEGHITAFVDPRHKGMGARIIAPASEGETWLAQRGFGHAPHGDYETLRIGLGIPDSLVDNRPEKTLLLENGFEELHGVNFSKGCYIGQEVTARTKHRANLHKLLYIVEADSPLPPPDTPIWQGAREVGEMRSSHGHAGLALIRREAVVAGGLAVDGAKLRVKLPEWREIADI